LPSDEKYEAKICILWKDEDTLPSDEKRRDAWISKTKLFELHLLEPKKDERFLCSRHFHPKFITRNARRVQLIPTAEPNECECDNCEKSVSSLDNSTVDELNDDESYNVNNTITLAYSTYNETHTDDSTAEQSEDESNLQPTSVITKLSNAVYSSAQKIASSACDFLLNKMQTAKRSLFGEESTAAPNVTEIAPSTHVDINDCTPSEINTNCSTPMKAAGEKETHRENVHELDPPLTPLRSPSFQSPSSNAQLTKNPIRRATHYLLNTHSTYVSSGDSDSDSNASFEQTNIAVVDEMENCDAEEETWHVFDEYSGAWRIEGQRFGSITNERDRNISLMIDEIVIRTELSYDPKTDSIEGFEDLGHLGRKPRAATHITVFMIRGLAGKWKLPISYYPSKNGIKSGDLKELIIYIVMLLTNLGLRVRAIVCDQATTNRTAMKNLARSCTFLKERHIRPTPFTKMKVIDATQIFSAKMVAAILTAVDTGELKEPTAQDTAAFGTRVNKIFDMLNSRTNFPENPMERPLSDKNPHIKRELENALNWLQQIKVQNGKENPPCIDGLKLTIRSALFLWSDLKSEGWEFLLTSRLLQDAIENFFAMIRQRGGFRDNPSVREFRYEFRWLIHMLRCNISKRSNCENDDDNMLISTCSNREIPCASNNKDSAITQSNEPNSNENEFPIDTQPEFDFNDKEQQLADDEYYNYDSWETESESENCDGRNFIGKIFWIQGDDIYLNRSFVSCPSMRPISKTVWFGGKNDKFMDTSLVLNLDDNSTDDSTNFWATFFLCELTFTLAFIIKNATSMEETVLRETDQDGANFSGKYHCKIDDMQEFSNCLKSCYEFEMLPKTKKPVTPSASIGSSLRLIPPYATLAQQIYKNHHRKCSEYECRLS
ncbi:hypothetical protein B566_EDAN018166, partial [Ephemera danica]